MKKSNKSRFFMTGIATAVAVSTTVPAVTASAQGFFKDVSKSNALYPEIHSLFSQGKLDGYKDGTFRPHEVVTRGQAAKIITSILDLNTQSVKDPGLKDVQKGKWYYGSVAALIENGIVSGFKDNTFRPDQVLTRSEAARMISEAFNLTYDSKTAVKFKDVKNNKWYYKYVQSLVYNGVTVGKTKDSFAPDAQVTRAELVGFASRANNNQVSAYTIDSVKDGVVTIDGTTYKVTDKIKGLFSSNNQAALKNAKMSFQSKDGVILKVKSLTLVNNGSSNENIVIDAAGATIDGSVVVKGDYYNLKNLTITGNLSIADTVQNSFITEKLTVKGNTSVAGQASIAEASVYNAAATKTRVTIVFKDSTIATIEIAQDDVYFSAIGSTTVTAISLHANANIMADPDVIIPKVDIKKGVTHVELNVTIKDIIIESDDDIKLTGKGNVDNIVINSDKKVTLDTTGKINNLESKNENSQVSVGDHAKIGNVKLPDGKKPSDVIQNYDQVKDQIEQVGGSKNPDATPPTPSVPSNQGTQTPGNPGTETPKPENPDGETGDYFAVGLLKTDEFGYVKLNVKNQGKYKVKYELVNKKKLHEFVLPKAGEQVPQGAIEYHDNDKVLLWSDYEIFVYQVDANDKIVEAVDVNEVWHMPPFEVKANIETKKLTISSGLNPEGKTPAQFFENIYLFNTGSVTQITDFSNIEWKMVNGIPTIELSYGEMFDPTKMNEYKIEGASYGATGSIYENVKGDENADAERDEYNLFMIKYAAEHLNDVLFTYLGRAAYEIDKIVDANGNVINTVHRSLANLDSLSLQRYIEEIKKQGDSLDSLEKVKEMVIVVNEELKVQLVELKEAQAAVNGLFREDKYDYPENDRLRPGLTQADIDKARNIVNQLKTQFNEKQFLLTQIDSAQYYFIKDKAEQEFNALKTEITLPESISIGDSLNDLLLGKDSVLEMRIDVIGNESNGNFVSGNPQYLGINGEGKLILNLQNSSDEVKTEYVMVTIKVAGNYLGQKVFAVKIPSSQEQDGLSSDAYLWQFDYPEFIKGIVNNPTSPVIGLKGTVTVDQLKGGVHGMNNVVQTYEVEGTNGEVKEGTDQVEQGDKLIVTAENGKTKVYYNVEFPIELNNPNLGELGHFTVNVENTTVEELQNDLRMTGKNPFDEFYREVKFTVEKVENEENMYEIMIENAKLDAEYTIRSEGRPIWGNVRDISWNSYSVIDAGATPDNIALISVIDGLNFTDDSFEILVSENNRDWSKTAIVDGMTIGSQLEGDGEGKFKITFTTTGQFDGQLDHTGHLFVNVKAKGVDNKDSIHLNIDEAGNVTVQ